MKKKNEMDSTNRGERKTEREDVRLCYTTLIQEKYGMRFRHGTINADAPNTESRHCGVIVSDGCYIFPTL